MKDRYKKVLNITISFSLLIIFIFLVFVIVCVFTSTDIKCISERFYRILKISPDKVDYISSTLYGKALEEQKIETFITLHKSKEELKRVLKWISELHAKKDEYIRTNGKLSCIFKDIYFLFSNKEKGSDISLARKLTFKVSSNIFDILYSNKKMYLSKYNRLLGMLEDRRRYLERRIEELSGILASMTNKNNSITKLSKMYNYSSNMVSADDEYKIAYKAEIMDVNNNEIYSDDISQSQFEKNVASLRMNLQEILNNEKDIYSEYLNRLKVKKDIKRLFNRAIIFEKRKRYEDALKIYKSLLVFNLSPADREILVNKITKLSSETFKIREKREHNRKATQLLLEAEALEKEGNIKDAIGAYKKIIEECRESDFIDKAVEGLINLKKNG